MGLNVVEIHIKFQSEIFPLKKREGDLNLREMREREVENMNEREEWEKGFKQEMPAETRENFDPSISSLATRFSLFLSLSRLQIASLLLVPLRATTTTLYLPIILILFFIL